VTKLNVAEAKKQLSDLLVRVAHDGETILITQRGKPVAKLVRVENEDEPEHLGNVRGWLEDDDPFFAAVEEIVEARFEHQPRSSRDFGAARKGSRS